MAFSWREDIGGGMRISPGSYILEMLRKTV
jgi:hypothetical protein